MEEQSEKVKKFLSLVSDETSGWLEKAEQREKMREILKKHRKGYTIVESLIMKVMEEFGNLQREEGKRVSENMPEIVCICGSGRFLKEMHEVEERLTLEGKIVLMIGVNTKDVARTAELEHHKPMLDELHLRKIDLSDRVFIVNVDGYIGESTKREIEYSKSKGKPITYLEPPLPELPKVNL